MLPEEDEDEEDDDELHLAPHAGMYRPPGSHIDTAYPVR